MRPKAPISKTLSVSARERGYPEKFARRVFMYEPETDTFTTLDDCQRFGEQRDWDDLGWILALIQAPQAPSDIERWLKDFARGGLTAHPIKSSSRTIRLLLGQIKVGIEGFVIRREPWEVPLKGNLTKRIEWIGRMALASYSGDLQTAVLLRVTDLLENYGAMIKPCSQQSCGRLFLKHKRQEFCSKNCSQRTRTARLQSDPGWTDKRHEYYRKKIARLDPERAQHVRQRTKKITDGERSESR